MTDKLKGIGCLSVIGLAMIAFVAGVWYSLVLFLRCLLNVTTLSNGDALFVVACCYIVALLVVVVAAKAFHSGKPSRYPVLDAIVAAVLWLSAVYMVVAGIILVILMKGGEGMSALSRGK